MINKNSLKVFLIGFIFLFIIFFLGEIIFIKNNKFSQNNDPASLEKSATLDLRIEPENLVIKNGELSNVKAFLGDEDVTEKVFWASLDDKIVFVSDTEGIQGQISALSVGDSAVSALYEEKNIRKEIPVKVEPIPLSVFCEPSSSIVKVGEKVRWILYYREKGVAPYNYKWEGDDDFIGSEGMEITSYQSPGIKRARVWTSDVAGAEATAECKTLLVE